MEKIVILGAGGHAKSLIDTITAQGKYEITGLVSQEGASVLSYPVLGDDTILEQLYKSGIQNAAMGIGYTGNGNTREQLYLKLKKIGYKFPPIIDPQASIGKNVQIGEGTFVGKRTVINAESRLGNLSIINTSAIIEHECVIEDYTHVAVAAVVCGNVRIGKSCLIGANSTIIQGIHITDNVVVGAGGTVIKDIGNCGVYVGSPARRTKDE